MGPTDADRHLAKILTGQVPDIPANPERVAALLARVRGLEEALRPLAAVAAASAGEWQELDDVFPVRLPWLLDGPRPTVGDLRRAVRVLAEGP